MKNYIFHYTNIEILELILKNKTIRFNRLDKMDDLEESRTNWAGINMNKLILVSCWSDAKEESIPQWMGYAKGEEGVMLSLPSDMFPLYPAIIPNKKGNWEKVYYPMPLNECEIQDYIFPIWYEEDSDFLIKIKYTDDIAKEINQFITVKNNIANLDFGKFGFYKHRRWEFQSEVRFILHAFPDNRFILNNGDLNRIELPFTFKDLKLKDDIFDKLTITLSPSATEVQKEKVNELQKLHAPKAIIRDSSFKDKIKLK